MSGALIDDLDDVATELAADLNEMFTDLDTGATVEGAFAPGATEPDPYSPMHVSECEAQIFIAESVGELPPERRLRRESDATIWSVVATSPAFAGLRTVTVRGGRIERAGRF